MDAKALKQMAVRTQEQQFVEIRDKIKNGGRPGICGLILTDNQVREIYELLLPFTTENQTYFKKIVLPHSMMKWQRE